MVTQRLEETNILATYSPAKQRLLLFDYDGTLTPIVEDPAAAILSHEALKSIERLAANPRNAVWIISGRNQSFLEQLFGHLNDLGLVAEHGSFLRPPGTPAWDDRTADADMRWKEGVTEAFELLTEMTPGSRVEAKRAAVVWHFRQADQRLATLQAAHCKKDLEGKFGRDAPVEFIDGKCVLEARLKTVNKGQIVQGLVAEMNAASGKFPDFVLCFGDDVTDEDMFRGLRISGLPMNTVYTVSIGDDQKLTNANWTLSDATEVIATIMTLNKSDEQLEEDSSGQDSDSKRSSKALPVPRSDLLGSSP